MEGVLEPDDLSWSYSELNPPPPNGLRSRRSGLPFPGQFHTAREQ